MFVRICIVLYCCETIISAVLDSGNIIDENINKNPTVLDEESQEHQQIDYAIRPALRHHIAHFCPNLKVARDCIRQCMTMGKPAFCGKDHVCYCGHNYGNPSNHKENPEETYNQFQDLYEKYFGSKGLSE